MRKILVPGLLAGVAMLVTGMMVTQIFNAVFPTLATEYTNPGLFRSWSDPIMSLFFLYPFLLGLILAWVWDKTKKLLSSKDIMTRGWQFGASYWVISSIPGMFITYSSFPVSLLLVISWSISGLVQAGVAGWLFAKMNP